MDDGVGVVVDDVANVGIMTQQENFCGCDVVVEGRMDDGTSVVSAWLLFFFPLCWVLLPVLVTDWDADEDDDNVVDVLAEAVLTAMVSAVEWNVVSFSASTWRVFKFPTTFIAA